MIEILSELITPLSVLLIVVFMVHKPLLNRFGPTRVYGLWLLVPLSLLAYAMSSAGFINIGLGTVGFDSVGLGNGQFERFIVSSTTAIKSGFDASWLSSIWIIGMVSFVLSWLVSHWHMSRKLKLQAYQLPNNLVDIPHNFLQKVM